MMDQIRRGAKEHQERQGPVALAPASFARRIDQKLNLGWGQVFAVARVRQLFALRYLARRSACSKVLDTATVA
jgi:hypothetical protein